MMVTIGLIFIYYEARMYHIRENSLIMLNVTVSINIFICKVNFCFDGFIFFLIRYKFRMFFFLLEDTVKGLVRWKKYEC